MKNGWYLIWAIVIIILVGFLFSSSWKMNDECEKRGMEYCIQSVIDCFDDCTKLDLDYFKFDSGGFGSDECWCQIKEGTKQIW